MDVRPVNVLADPAVASAVQGFALPRTPTPGYVESTVPGEDGAVTCTSGRVGRVEDVHPPGDGIQDLLGRTDTHEVSGGIPWEEAYALIHGLPHLLHRFAEAEPTYAVAIEPQLHQLPGTTHPELTHHTPLGDREEQLVFPLVGLEASTCPEGGAPCGIVHHLLRGSGWRTIVQHHRHVGAETLLKLHNTLWGELAHTTAHVVPEHHALVVLAHQKALPNHLETARICKDGPRPSHEPV